MYLIILFLFKVVKSCVIRSSEINLVDFLLINGDNPNILYTMDNNTVDNETCYFTKNESITIIIDRLDDYIFTIERLADLYLQGNSTNNTNSIHELQLVFFFIEALKNKDLGKLGLLCHNISDFYYNSKNSSGFFSYYKDKSYKYLFDTACSYIMSIQKENKITQVIYRGKNLTTLSPDLLAARYFFKRKFEQSQVNETTTVVLTFIQKAAIYFKNTQYYLSNGLDSLTSYLNVQPVHFSYHWAIGYTTIKGIVTNPITFWYYMKNNQMAKNYTKRFWEKHNNTISRPNLGKYLNILKVWGKDFFRKSTEHFSTREIPDFLDSYRNSDYDDFEYFNNGTCYPQESPEEDDYHYILVFDYIVLHGIINLFDPNLSEWTPEQKNTTSIFSVYMPRDWIKFIIIYINNWRRSKLVNYLFEDWALEEDTENCKPGWPLYRDPQFGCPVTIFRFIPFWYSLAEAAIIKQGLNTEICDQWDSLIGTMQGWVQYLNAIVTPYTNFPILLPFFGYFICNYNILKAQFAWAFFKVDGKIKCYYYRDDLPPFCEKCLFLKGLIFFFLVFIYIYITVVFFYGIYKLIRGYSNKFAVLNRIATLERRVFRENRIVIIPPEHRA
jgi:hypothetical protein